MICGKTETGFEFELEEDVIDDYELIEELCALDEGQYQHLPKALVRILGAEQTARLKEHVRNESGKVSADRLMNEIGSILTAEKATKNS